MACNFNYLFCLVIDFDKLVNIFYIVIKKTTLRVHLTPTKIWLKLKNQVTIGVHKDAENLDPPHIASGTVKWYNCFTNQFGKSSKG